MLTIDWIMLAILVAGAVRGWQLGCVRQLVSLVAFFAGLIVAKMFYMMLGEAIAPHLGDHATVANLLAFVLIWVAVPTVLSMVGEVLNTILDKLFVLGTINRMLGTLLCFVKFHLIIGAVVWVTLFVGGGYFFGNIPVIKQNFTLVTLGIVIFSVLPVLWELVGKKLFHKE